MKILLDYRLVQSFYPRGVAVFGISLLKYFVAARVKYDLEVSILIDDRLPRFFIEEERQIECISLNILKNSKLYFDCFFNTSTIVLWQSEINAIDFLYPEIVLERCQKIACKLHDFIPLLIRNYLPSEISMINYALQLEAIKRCDYIFTNSTYTAKCASVYLGIPMEKITIIWGFIDDRFYNGKQYISPNRSNNIVSVLGYCPRKNAERLVVAWGIAKKNGNVPMNACLYVLSYSQGRDKLLNICEENHIDKKSLKVLDYISIKEMIDLVSGAKATIFPSYLEGLGLPILESYAAGTPCFAADTSSTKELVSEESTFDPFSKDEIAGKIIDIYKNEDLCKRNLEFGKKLLTKITGENIIEIILRKLMD